MSQVGILGWRKIWHHKQTPTAPAKQSQLTLVLTPAAILHFHAEVFCIFVKMFFHFLYFAFSCFIIILYLLGGIQFIALALWQNSALE